MLHWLQIICDNSAELWVRCSFNSNPFSVSQAQVVDGANGHIFWTAEFVCPGLSLEPSAVSTSTGQSAFLFWASEPIKAQKNATKTTVSLLWRMRTLLRQIWKFIKQTVCEVYATSLSLSTLALQVTPGIAAAQPLIRRLFLLHPAYPTILLELTSTTDTAVTSAGKSKKFAVQHLWCKEWWVFDDNMVITLFQKYT